MKSLHENNAEYSRSLAYWRTNAGPTFIVMLGVITVTSFLRMPDFRFIGACAFSGLAIFLSWCLDPMKRLYASLAAAVVGIVVALLGLWAVIGWPLPILFAQGIGTTAASFSLCMVIWNAKNS